MIFGVVSGMRVLFWALVVLFGIIYFLGVVTSNLFRATYQEFRNVPTAMLTVFRCFTDGCSAFDGTPLQEKLWETYGPLFALIYVLVMMLVTFGLFNLIMAIFM